MSAILSQSRRGFKAQTGLTAPQIGHLYRLDGATGTATDVSDFGDQSYQWTADHANLFEDFPDSNPFAVLRTSGDQQGEDGDGERGEADGQHGARTYVADAGANTISKILRHGRARVIAYIPNETSGAFRDATPTCIAQGPNGALYIGALDLVSNFVVGPRPVQRMAGRPEPVQLEAQRDAVGDRLRQLLALGALLPERCRTSRRPCDVELPSPE